MGFRLGGTHRENPLISNRAIVEDLLTLTDNSNYFSAFAFWSLPNVSWQIIKKTSGLFDMETKQKKKKKGGVFLAARKGCQLCSGGISAQEIIHVPLPARTSPIKKRQCVEKLEGYSEWQFFFFFFQYFMRL